ncbi:MAG: 30S ribosome-binding factor RbfA [Clostridiales bacterium]|nr:30S ribosome-binding factor RbfA [Clostridiales bacterium]
MASHRHDRLAEDIRRELTDIFRTLKDPRISGMISIVKVDLAGDQSHCKVYISSLDGTDAANRAVEGLSSASGFIRREIGSRLKMRRSPEFKFISDNSIEHSADIAKILIDLERK